MTIRELRYELFLLLYNQDDEITIEQVQKIMKDFDKKQAGIKNTYYKEDKRNEKFD